MPHKISISKNGIFCCGSTFIDAVSGSAPCTFSYMRPDVDGESFVLEQPVYVTFSCHASSRSARGIQRKNAYKNMKNYKAGDHAALCYINSGSFFSILVLRCDTWSVQWAVASLEDSMKVRQIELLDAHLLCGLASETNSSKHQVFLASRLNCKFLSAKANRSLRHFVAKPQFIDLGLEAGTIISISDVSANSILALTEAGSLHLVKFAYKVQDSDFVWSVAARAVIANKIEYHRKAVEMVCSTNNECSTLIIYSPESTTLSIISFSNDCENPGAVVHRISIPQAFQLHRVEFVGQNHFVITLEDRSSHTAAFEFGSFFSSNTNRQEFVEHEVLRLEKIPVVSYFNAETDEHVVVCANKENWNLMSEQSLSIELLVRRKFSFADGPYTAKVIRGGVWRTFNTVHDTYQDLLRSEHLKQDDLHGILNLIAPKDVTDSTSLRLFYPLLNPDETHSFRVAVFCVDTFPHFHNRLVKQFHNATQGLQQLLVTGSPMKHPFLLPWNPRHIRRALRSLSPEQAGSLFHDIAELMRSAASGSILAASRYAEISTAACTVGMHIITLSRQMGVVLEPKDIQILSALFRSSRAISHECFGSLSRMKLIFESCVQQRRVNSFLYVGKDGAMEVPNNQEDDATQHAEFFPASNNVELSRVLQTRYDTNSWAAALQANMPHHIQIAKAALQYVTNAYNFNPHAGCKDIILSDWRSLGQEPGLDLWLNAFESTLIGDAPMKEQE